MRRAATPVDPPLARAQRVAGDREAKLDAPAQRSENLQTTVEHAAAQTQSVVSSLPVVAMPALDTLSGSEMNRRDGSARKAAAACCVLTSLVYAIANLYCLIASSLARPTAALHRLVRASFDRRTAIEFQPRSSQAATDRQQQQRRTFEMHQAPSPALPPSMLAVSSPTPKAMADREAFLALQKLILHYDSWSEWREKRPSRRQPGSLRRLRRCRMPPCAPPYTLEETRKLRQLDPEQTEKPAPSEGSTSSQQPQPPQTQQPHPQKPSDPSSTEASAPSKILDPAARECHECADILPPHKFSRHQLKRGGKRVCSMCVALRTLDACYSDSEVKSESMSADVYAGSSDCSSSSPPSLAQEEDYSVHDPRVDEFTLYCCWYESLADPLSIRMQPGLSPKERLCALVPQYIPHAKAKKATNLPANLELAMELEAASVERGENATTEMKSELAIELVNTTAAASHPASLQLQQRAQIETSSRSTQLQVHFSS
jgi:hypothetical protein